MINEPWKDSRYDLSETEWRWFMHHAGFSNLVLCSDGFWRGHAHGYELKLGHSALYISRSRALETVENMFNGWDDEWILFRWILAGRVLGSRKRDKASAVKKDLTLYRAPVQDIIKAALNVYEIAKQQNNDFYREFTIT